MLRLALPQLAPIWLSRTEGLTKVIDTIKAAKDKADLIVFSEGFVPGYPFWLDGTGGARFNDDKQKEIFAHYSDQAVTIEAGHLDAVCAVLKELKMACYLGIIERAGDRSGHSLYCSFVYIDKTGTIQSVHRKLMPTYEERLTWSPGDGHGLRVHDLPPFTVGGLNCWENWLPLARASLYAQGENLHVAVWPGAVRNTDDLTRFIAKESRSFVISVSGLMTIDDFPKNTPHLDEIIKEAPHMISNGGSCISRPNGEWLIAPIAEKEGLFVETLDINEVYQERQNMDVSGHYSRPDVTKLVVNRERQSVVKFEE